MVYGLVQKLLDLLSVILNFQKNSYEGYPPAGAKYNHYENIVFLF